MIKHSAKIIHLDLSYMGITFDMMQKIVASIRKSKTLLSIHLSGNLLEKRQEEYTEVKF